MPKPRPNNTEFWRAAKRMSKSSIQYYEKLTELSISMFDWKNLPDSIDSRFLELSLFGDGMCVFFKDEDMDDYLALRCMIGGRLNVYQIPTERRAYASNGYNKALDETNSVIIFNNMLHTNSVLDVQIMSERLAEIDNIIMVNAKAQKTPILIICDEKQRLTMKNLYMKYEGNEPVIFGDSNLNPKAITAIHTEAPYVGDKLIQLKTQIWNEALTYLGISNLNIQKKERLVSDEVVRNQGGVIASRYSRLNARRQAAEQINKMFGLDIEVEFREDFREADDEVMIAGETGDEQATNMVTDFRTA